MTLVFELLFFLVVVGGVVLSFHHVTIALISFNILLAVDAIYHYHHPISF